MRVFWKLLGDFAKDKFALLAVFIVIALIAYPLESVYIPDKAGKLAGKIKSDLPEDADRRSRRLASIRKQIMFLLGLYLVLVVLRMGRSASLAGLVPAFRERARREIYSRILRRSERNFEEVPTGKAIYRIHRIASSMSDVVYFFLGQLIPLVALLVSVCVYMLSINRRLGMVCVLLVVFFFGSFSALARWLISVSRKTEASAEETVDEWQNKMSNMLNIVMTGSVDREDKHNAESQQREASNTKRRMSSETVFQTALSGFAIALFCTLALLSFAEYRKGNIKGSRFASVGIVSLMVSNMLNDIAQKTPRYINDLGIIANSSSYLDALWAEDVDPAAAGRDGGRVAGLPDRVRGHVRLEGLTFAYEGGEPVLRDFSLEISPGERVALFGTSGSGKTTIAKLLLGLKQPQAGRILLDGTDLARVRPSEIRRVISMSNQQMTLFSGSVVENMTYSVEPVVRVADVERMLRSYGLHEVFAKLNGGLDASVGVDGRGMSNGMQKTIMNVRSLLRAREASVVILDEPLAGLDDATRRATSKFITDMTKGKTLLIISHHPEISTIVDRVVHMSPPQSDSLGHQIAESDGLGAAREAARDHGGHVAGEQQVRRPVPV